jgi:two-component system CheB/CheR fusion protein
MMDDNNREDPPAIPEGSLPPNESGVPAASAETGSGSVNKSPARTGNSAAPVKKPSHKSQPEKILVVGIGASAGGIEALEQFFENLPLPLPLNKNDSKVSANANLPDIAFVVVTHLSPEHESNLTSIIQKHTALKVIQVTKQIEITPNTVYVVPPAKQLLLKAGKIELEELEKARSVRAPIDLFFRTLADSHGDWSAAIVLSGSGTDGSIGLPRVKETGGLTIAQEPTQATFSEMPRSAIATGFVDVVLPVEQIGEWLLNYTNNRHTINLNLAADEDINPPETTASPLFTAPNGEESYLEEPENVVPSEGERERSSDSDSDIEGIEKVESIKEEVDSDVTQPVDLVMEILAHLRVRTGHNFARYKRGTLNRRIERRMQVNNLPDLPSYLKFLNQHPGEVQALLRDLLISVTNFFRDKEVWDYLETMVIPGLFKGKTSAESTVRVWVAGCATGEEAYSIAILLHEYASRLIVVPKLQIFATDLDEYAIGTAREGSYPETIALDVSADRLQRFFNQSGRRYRVRKEIRETILFAKHDLLKDPPFSKVDLVSCRNLLIYLDREAQQQLLGLFHFALKPTGILMVGTSETADSQPQLFSNFDNDKKHHIYSRRAVSPSLQTLSLGGIGSNLKPQRQRLSPGQPQGQQKQTNLEQNPEATNMLLLGSDFSGIITSKERVVLPPEIVQPLQGSYAQAGVVVNENLEIVYFSEQAGRYLQLGGGEPTFNLVRLLQSKLRFELLTKIQPLNLSGLDLLQTAKISKTRWVKLMLGGTEKLVRIVLQPIKVPTALQRYTLVTFDEIEVEIEVAASEAGSELIDSELQTQLQPLSQSYSEDQAGPGSQIVSPTTTTYPGQQEVQALIQRLQEEVVSLNSHLQITVEQYETAGEEHKAAIEELQAMNEELRSATEELETSREELQALNEEMLTVNHELKIKYEEVSAANSNLQNLISSTDIATIFLDRQLKLKFYTPRVEHIFNVIPTDVGRPLAHLTHRLEYSALPEDTERVLADLVPLEREIRTVNGEGNWYIMRVLPYRTLEDQIDGVVITLTNITTRKEAEIALRASEERFRRLSDSGIMAIAFFDHSGGLTEANDTFLHMIGYTQYDLRAGLVRWDKLTPPEWMPRTRQALEEFAEKGIISPYEKEYFRRDGSRFWGLFGGARLYGSSAGISFVVDITERKRAEEALQVSEEKYRTLFNSMNDGFCILEKVQTAPGEPVDFRYLDPNPAFEEFTGLHDATGKTVREMIPDIEQSVMDTYDTVLTTGQPYYFEPYISALDSWYAARTFPTNTPGQVGVIFTNITYRKKAEIAIQKDLKATTLLRELGAKLIPEGNIQVIYDEIVQAAINLTNADAGTIQILDSTNQVLTILADKGLPPHIPEHFRQVDAGSNTSCGIALANGTRTFVDYDVPESVDPGGSLRMHFEAGILSAQSTPLVSRSGKPIGMVSTHWRTHHRPTEHELRYLDLLARQVADLLEQHQAQQALRESEEKYRSLFASIDEGFGLIEMIYDETGGGAATDIRYLEVNQNFERLTGVPNAAGRLTSEIVPGLEPYWFEDYNKVAQTGEPMRIENYNEFTGRWYTSYASRVGGAGSRLVAIVFQDITERKQNEQRQEFLLKLSDALRPLTDTLQIQKIVCEMVAEYLQVDRCYYSDVSVAEDWTRVEWEYIRGGFPSIVGTYTLAAFSWAIEPFLRGETFVLNDLASFNALSEAERTSMAAIYANAMVCVPLTQAGKWVACFAVTQATPRQWKTHEIELIREVGERIWATIERARAESALRESQATIQSFYDTAPFMMGIGEIDYGNGRTIAISGNRMTARYFDEQPDTLAGQSAPELGVTPDTQALWLEHIHRSQEEGAPVHFEYEDSQTEDKIWLGVTVAIIGKGSSGRPLYSFIAEDITERKLAEKQLQESEERQAFLLRFSDVLRAESNPDTVANQALALLYEHMELDRSYITSYRLEDNRAYVNHQLGNELVPPLPPVLILSDFPEALKVVTESTLVIEDDFKRQGLSEDEKLNSQKLGMRAMVAATLRKGDNRPLWSMVAISASPRRWTPGEIRLVEEVAERTWTAMERARVGEALEQSERKYRTLFETMGQGYCELELVRDADGHVIDQRYLELNSAFERLFGVSAAAARNHTASEMLAGIEPGLEPWWAEAFDRIVKRGEPETIEHQVEAWGRWFAVYIYPQGGDRLIALYEEITERKEHEERQAFLLKFSDTLRPLAEPAEIQAAATRLLREQFDAGWCYYVEWNDALTLGVVRKDATREGLPSLAGSHDVSDVPEFLEFLGAGHLLNVADYAGFELLTPRIRERYTALGVRAILGASLVKKGRPVALLLLADTEERQWSESAVNLIQETAERTWAAIERARAEAALQESEQNLRAIANIVPDLLWYSEPDGSTPWYNQRWLEYTGQNFEEATGWGWVDAIHPDDRANSARQYREAVESGRPLEQEHRILSAAGEYRFFLSRSEPLLDEQGRVVRMYGAAIDIHERKLAQEELERRIKERTVDLAQANLQLGIANTQLQKDRERLRELSLKLLEVQEAERRYLARELHDEIGQFLTGLKFQLEINRQIIGEKLEEKAVEQFTDTISTIDGLTARVRDLSLNLRPTLLDDMGLQPALLDLFGRFTNQTGIEVRFFRDGLAEQRFAPAIETTVYRLVQEALTNIARYAQVSEAMVNIMVQKEQQQIILLIQDEGAGFEVEEVRAKHNSTGLSAMRERVELVEGKFTIESEPGIGTTLVAEISMQPNTGPAGDEKPKDAE